MTVPYRKRYPAGAAPSPARRWLLALLRRTPGRRARWHQQAQRRRPWLLRPLTVGEKTLLTYKGMAHELSRLLEPFRRTRPKGHRDLQELLYDAEARPVVVAQVQALQACLARVEPEYGRQGQQLDRWREQWPRLTAPAQQRLREEEKALCLSYYHDGLRLLVQEAKSELEFIKRLYPTAFTLEPAPEPWLDNASPPTKPATPTPYS